MQWHTVFFMLLLIFLPTQLGYHAWPDWSMVLGRRVDYLSPTIFLTDILLLLTVGSWFISEISNIKYQISNIHTKYQKAFIPLILMVLFVLVNVLLAASKPVAIYRWLKVAEFSLLGLYIVKTTPGFPLVIRYFSLGVLYSSLIAIGQFFLQHSIGGPLWWLGERTFTVDTPGIARTHLCQLSIVNCQLLLRPYATFPHPNVLGGYLAAVLPLAIYQLTNLPIYQLTRKFFYLIAFVLGIIALVLTFSRSAIIVGMAGVLYALWKIKGQTLKIFVLLFLVFSSWFLVQGLRSEDESITVRSQLNVAAITLWQRSPLFGVGLGNFLVRLPEVLLSRSVYFLQPVHNIYLLLLAEVGMVGIGFIVFCVATFLKHESRIMKYGKDKTKFIIHNSLFIILLLGLVDHYPLTVQQGQLLLTVFIALSYASRPSSS